jgi:hypothetical protein
MAGHYSFGADHYSFGVEIELLARPRDRHAPIRQEAYFARFADALNAQGVPARADDLRHTSRRRPEEYSRGWWITRDGSISTTDSTGRPSTFLIGTRIMLTNSLVQSLWRLFLASYLRDKIGRMRSINSG